jgi:lambda family phage portal protein
MKRNLLDRTIEFFAPHAALQRYAHKTRLDVVLTNMEKLKRSQQRRFDAASKGRHYSDWHSAELSVNQEILQSLSILRNRSRDLGRNNAYAINATRIIANNVVGTGIIPSPRGISESRLKLIKELWGDWAGKTVCDYDDTNTIYGLQWLIMKTIVESGECLVRRVRCSSKEVVPLRLQVLEGDFIDTAKHNGVWQDDNTITYYGIKFNRQGRRLGYWLFKGHPNEFGGESEFVDAKEIIHLYDVERPGQIRGVPLSCGVMLRLKDLEDYEFTERTRAKVAASFAVFITEDSVEADHPGSGQQLERIEPGTIEYLPPGKQVSFAQPPTSDGYGAYVKNNLRGISSGFGTSYESLTNDYGNVNFSSGRMGWLEMNKNIERLQWNLMVARFCDKVYPWFIEVIQLAGHIPMTATPRVTWTPPRRQMIDPLKEVQAIKEEMRAGITSWQEVVRMYGYVPEELMEELKKDKEMWDLLGLMPTGDARFDNNRPPEELGEDTEDNQQDKPKADPAKQKKKK